VKRVSQSAFKAVLGRRLRVVLSKVGRLIFERDAPEDSDEWVSLETLGGNPEHTRYEPSPFLLLQLALRRERIDRHNVFVDYGSGKGRAVFLAARRPFGRAMGVEISGALNDAASRNLEAVRGRLRTREVTFVTADASDWRPPDDITHAYFYNPFSGSVFDAAARGLVASYDRVPRQIRLLYANPVEAATLEATGRFRHIRTVALPLNRGILSKRLDVYEITRGDNRM
jgi:SAM-dependent methyltransferase